MNTEAAPHHPVDWYVDHLEADAERFAVAIERGPLDAHIVACPGWDLSRLTEHLGFIHRWAAFCVTHVRAPDDEERAALDTYEPARAAEWLREGATRLASALRAVDPAAPAWHPWPVDPVGSFWPRRQAHETAVHRWDAEHAVGLESSIEPQLASDGIDEYFEAVVPRLLQRREVSVPSGSLHVHCTDIDGEWLMWEADGAYQMVREHQKGDVALRGPADALLRRLWGRPVDNDSCAVFGDEQVLNDWLALGGT